MNHLKNHWKDYLLVCLAVLIAILALMLSVAEGMYSRKFELQRVNESKDLQKALTNYFNEGQDKGSFPNGVLREEEIADLMEQLMNPSKVYLNRGSIDFSPSGFPVDPIGTPYVIEVRVSHDSETRYHVLVK